MFKKLSLAIGTVCMAIAAASAHADTIGPGASCASCEGSSYTLTYTNAGTNKYDVKLVVNTVGFNGPGGNTDKLNSVALKVTAQDPASVSVISEPAGFGTPSSQDLTGSGGSPGCGGSGGGFFCVQSATGVPVGMAGNIYTFDFLVTLNSGQTLLLGSNAASVKAGYLTSAGKNGGITSEAISLTPGTTVTPEPSSLMLLGSGLVGVAGMMRRKLFA